MNFQIVADKIFLISKKEKKKEETRYLLHPDSSTGNVAARLFGGKQDIRSGGWE